MARAPEAEIVTPPLERLIAIDGVQGDAIATAVQAIVSISRRPRAISSNWDASGIFDEASVSDIGEGQLSARTILLLYAADLAFRLQQEVRPALDAGRIVIVAPYVDTAIALGQATGIDLDWLTSVFSFAPRAAMRQHVNPGAVRSRADRRGFVGFYCRQIQGKRAAEARRDLVVRTQAYLAAMAQDWPLPETMHPDITTPLPSNQTGRDKNRERRRRPLRRIR
jgi:hypothetical protein